MITGKTEVLKYYKYSGYGPFEYNIDPTVFKDKSGYYVIAVSYEANASHGYVENDYIINK